MGLPFASYELLAEEYSYKAFQPCSLYLLCPGILVTMEMGSVT